MSGREHEPVAAFFPSIDRNLIRDLDRHLRNTRPSVGDLPAAPEPTPVAPAPTNPVARQTPRPKIASVVEAVEQAAHSIAAMTARIEDLEGHIDLLEGANRQLMGQLDEATRASRALDDRLKAETERATRLEALSAQQTTRATDLERELSAVHADLARVTEAITAALGVPEE